MWLLILILILIAVAAIAVLIQRYLPGDVPIRHRATTVRRSPPVEVSADVARVEYERAETAEPLLIIPAALLALIVLAIVLIARYWPHSTTQPQAAPTATVTVQVEPTATTVTTVAAPRPTATPTSTITRTVGSDAIYQTASRSVHVRAAPSTNSAIVATIGPFGSDVLLTCYQRGELVFGDPDWYRVNYDGVDGYVSGMWLDAGGGPSATTLPSC